MKTMLHTYVVLAWATLVAIFKEKFHLDLTHVHGIHALCLTALGLIWHSSITQHKVADLKAKIDSLLPQVTKTVTAVLLTLGLGVMGGCANTATMSDADFAAWVKSQAQTDVGASLTLAMAVDQAKAQEIKADALVAKGILDGPVAKLFSGANASAVTVSTVNAAIPLLKARLAGIKNGPAIAAAVQLAFGQVVNQLQLPGIPSATLSARTTLAIASIFSGASAGIGDATK